VRLAASNVSGRKRLVGKECDPIFCQQAYIRGVFGGDGEPVERLSPEDNMPSNWAVMEK